MASFNRRDFVKMATIGVPLAGMSAYELTRKELGSGPADIGPRAVNAAALPPGAVALKHARPGDFRTVPFPEMRKVFYAAQQTGGPPFDVAAHQPERVHSRGGVLAIDLVCRYAQPVVNGIPLNIRTYDGVLPGRTLVARPGDVLHIRLRNQFPPRNDDFIMPEDENIPHGFNNTNLHTHGLNVSPEGNEDNVLVEIHPGDDFQFDIRIPEDHPTGTFWYHPHRHGSVLPQLASGMAGFLLIVGPGELSEVPQLAGITEVDMVFQELILDSHGQVPDTTFPISELFKLQAFLQYTINGLAVNEGIDPTTPQGTSTPPVLHMRPGEVQRWRFGLLAHLQTYRFALEGHKLYVAAWDGITDDRLTVWDDLVLAPGNRVDLIIKASDTPGTYAFKMLQEPFGSNPLFTTPAPFGAPAELPVFNVIVGGGSSRRMSLPTTLNPPRRRLPYITPREIVRRRQIDFSVTGDVIFDLNTFQFIADTRQFFVNDQKFSSRRIDQTMLLDTAEEWTITNTPEINHPFHIHVNWMQVMEIRHADGTVERLNNGQGRWQDTIDLPFQGSVVVRHRFQNFPGLFVFHCHVIAHEDEGMMQLIEVVDPAPLTVRMIEHHGGVIVSPDATNRVLTRFLPDAIRGDADITYTYHLEPQYPVGALLGLERYFDLTSQPRVSVQRAALIDVKFPVELAGQIPFDLNTVRLYRWDGQAWSTQGINVLARRAGFLASSTSELGSFAVLAKPPTS
jgi:FtsP/CotA-like multicopper oxidase with cupredoxin domain